MKAGRHEFSDALISYGVVLLIGGILALLVLAPYFEAKTFNECTHSNATYWDALFADLKVQECKR